MSTSPDHPPSINVNALLLLARLPTGDDAWLSVEDILTTAQAYLVPAATAEEAEGLMRALKRRGFARNRRARDDSDAHEWQVTPAGTLAAAAL